MLEVGQKTRGGFELRHLEPGLESLGAACWAGSISTGEEVLVLEDQGLHPVPDRGEFLLLDHDDLEGGDPVILVRLPPGARRATVSLGTRWHQDPGLSPDRAKLRLVRLAAVVEALRDLELSIGPPHLLATAEDRVWLLPTAWLRPEHDPRTAEALWPYIPPDLREDGPRRRIRLPRTQSERRRCAMYGLGVLLLELATGRRQEAGVEDRLAEEVAAIPEAWQSAAGLVERCIRGDRWDEVADLERFVHRALHPRFDENVQFTVYRPGRVRPEDWCPLLAFAHLQELRPGESGPAPLEVVKNEAEFRLRNRHVDYGQTRIDASGPVPRDGELTFAPVMDGVEFNPPRISIMWMESVHWAEFRMRAAARLDGTVARGSMRVFLGNILLAEVTLRFKVDSGAPSVVREEFDIERQTAYRRIFASYSHRDTAVVRQVETYALGLGDRYLRDVRDIRAGEAWDPRIRELIDRADVFQLFWSSNSMRSEYVQKEWEYALSLGKPEFVRPTYWEQPRPEDPGTGLPPPELDRIQFVWVGLGQGEPPRIRETGPVIDEPTEGGDEGSADSSGPRPPDSRMVTGPEGVGGGGRRDDQRARAGGMDYVEGQGKAGPKLDRHAKTGSGMLGPEPRRGHSGRKVEPDNAVRVPNPPRETTLRTESRESVRSPRELPVRIDPHGSGVPILVYVLALAVALAVGAGLLLLLS